MNAGILIFAVRRFSGAFTFPEAALLLTQLKTPLNRRTPKRSVRIRGVAFTNTPSGFGFRVSGCRFESSSLGFPSPPLHFSPCPFPISPFPLFPNGILETARPLCASSEAQRVLDILSDFVRVQGKHPHNHGVRLLDVLECIFEGVGHSALIDARPACCQNLESQASWFCSKRGMARSGTKRLR